MKNFMSFAYVCFIVASTVIASIVFAFFALGFYFTFPGVKGVLLAIGMVYMIVYMVVLMVHTLVKK